MYLTMTKKFTMSIPTLFHRKKKKSLFFFYTRKSGEILIVNFFFLMKLMRPGRIRGAQRSQANGSVANESSARASVSPQGEGSSCSLRSLPCLRLCAWSRVEKWKGESPFQTQVGIRFSRVPGLVF